jgi:hypothetical protein
LFFLDECSINIGMTPLYGWGEKHVRVVDYVPDVRFRRKSLISVLGLEGFRASMVFKGTLNGEVFGYYVSEVLAPVLRAGDVLVLDNLSVHRVKGVLLPLLSMGVVVVYYRVGKCRLAALLR